MASPLSSTPVPVIRCDWATSHPLLEDYHDKEWGVPVHDDRVLFEMLNLEGAQAGLSWLTVLKKRATYNTAFDGFDASLIIKYSDKKREELMNNDGIIKNRLKINAVIENAKAYLEVQKEFGSFNNYIWQFTDNQSIIIEDANKKKTLENKSHALAQSVNMSKELKNKGFKFVGPTIMYAYMQAIGMINEHGKSCFRLKLK